jgi:hypothetical protein
MTPGGIRLFVAMPGSTMSSTPDTFVYLELGVRWAPKDRVTVLISQDIDDVVKFSDVKFRVMGNRVFAYGPKPNALRPAFAKMTESALEPQADDLVTPARKCAPAQAIGFPRRPANRNPVSLQPAADPPFHWAMPRESRDTYRRADSAATTPEPRTAGASW